MYPVTIDDGPTIGPSSPEKMKIVDVDIVEILSDDGDDIDDKHQDNDAEIDELNDESEATNDDDEANKNDKIQLMMNNFR